MIYDCFPFFNELDTIEIRFKELYNHVDYFVVSESNLTHSGKPKPLFFMENKERFKPFADKILHTVCSDPKKPEGGKDMNWTREINQRNAIFNVLKTRCQDNDVIIISDADEIVRGSRVAEIANIQHHKLYGLELTCSWYYLNLICEPKWFAGKCLTYLTLKTKFGSHLSSARVSGDDDHIANAGWHFGYMGGPNKVKEKLKSFAHQEFNKEEITNDDHINKVVRFGTSIWDEFKEVAPRGAMPFWKYIQKEGSHLPQCVINGEYDHMINDVYFSQYNYDCGNLYLINQLVEKLDGEGAIVDIGSYEGRASSYLANATKQSVHCFEYWNDEIKPRFIKNMTGLTNGNFVIENDINFIDQYNKIKVLHIMVDHDLVLSKTKNKIEGLVCGYNWDNEEVRNIVLSHYDDVQSSGNFWFKYL